VIRIENLHVEQGDFHLRDVGLEVPAGGYAVLMGRTGCGKTTVIEAICGLRRIAQGSIWLAGRNVTRLHAAERGIGYVPQDGALFSTMRVRDQLAFALTIRRRPRKEIQRRVAELADLLGIEGILHRVPRGLSGGEKQRVALGRALSFEPAVLLVDEPLSALDDHTRQQMYQVLRRVRRHTGATTLHVTHNREDAVELADQLFQFVDGRIEEQSLDCLAKSKLSTGDGGDQHEFIPVTKVDGHVLGDRADVSSRHRDET
jgi:molybdate/tungstate transport system ATP-binding protein